MTRAISIDAAPEVVWGWLAQMGRGAGWRRMSRLLVMSPRVVV
jgi:hypothetical protein